MNQGLKIAGIVVAGVVLVGESAFAGGMVARAQNPVPVMGPDMMFEFGGPGRGMIIERGANESQVQEALAKALGLTVDELKAELQSGKTIEQIAEEKGVSIEDLEKAMLDVQAAALAQAVKDGKLTQEQADQMLEMLKENPGMGMGFGFRMGPGRMNGFRGGPGFDERRDFGPGFRGGMPGMPGGPFGPGGPGGPEQNPQGPKPTPNG